MYVSTHIKKPFPARSNSDDKIKAGTRIYTQTRTNTLTQGIHSLPTVIMTSTSYAHTHNHTQTHAHKEYIRYQQDS